MMAMLTNVAMIAGLLAAGCIIVPAAAMWLLDILGILDD